MRSIVSAVESSCVVLLLAVAGCGDDPVGVLPDPQAVALESALADVLDVLDAAHPGRGLTDYPIETPQDIPKAYAMVVKADGLLRPTSGRLRDMAATSVSWLMTHADENADSIVGWGLPFEWDAFGEGVVNPANTEYAISTAIAVEALLAQRGSPTVDEDHVHDLAWRSITPFFDPARLTPGVLPAYSLTPQDRSWDVFNTAVYLAVAAQRLSTVLASPTQAAQLRDYADSVMTKLADARLIAANGAWYWLYLVPGSRVNDLPHAAYIIYSIEEYTRLGGRLASRFPREEIWRHLDQFLAPDQSWIRAYPNFEPGNDPARLYDLGFAMALVCARGDSSLELRRALVNAIPQYRMSDGHYAKFPVRGPAAVALPPLIVNEYETYLLWGVANCIASPRP